MQKGLGIAALVLSIIAIFIPFLGTWLTVVAAGLAAFAYGPGFALGVAGIVIDILHIFFFSPLLWATGGLAAVADGAAKAQGALGAEGASAFMLLPWILVAIQIAALVFLIKTNKKQPATGEA
jgi:hypothetical protein